LRNSGIDIIAQCDDWEWARIDMEYYRESGEIEIISREYHLVLDVMVVLDWFRSGI
jgi:hypothetical protein